MFQERLKPLQLTTAEWVAKNAFGALNLCATELLWNKLVLGCSSHYLHFRVLVWWLASLLVKTWWQPTLLCLWCWWDRCCRPAEREVPKHQYETNEITSWPDNVENMQMFPFTGFTWWFYQILCNRSTKDTVMLVCTLPVKSIVRFSLQLHIPTLFMVTSHAQNAGHNSHAGGYFLDFWTFFIIFIIMLFYLGSYLISVLGLKTAGFLKTFTQILRNYSQPWKINETFFI